MFGVPCNASDVGLLARCLDGISTNDGGKHFLCTDTDMCDKHTLDALNGDLDKYQGSGGIGGVVLSINVIIWGFPLTVCSMLSI